MWDCGEALRFGRRLVQVVVLRLGWDPRTTAPSLIELLFGWRDCAARLPNPPGRAESPLGRDAGTRPEPRHDRPGQRRAAGSRSCRRTCGARRRSEEVSEPAVEARETRGQGRIHRATELARRRPSRDSRGSGRPRRMAGTGPSGSRRCSGETSPARNRTTAVGLVESVGHDEVPHEEAAHGAPRRRRRRGRRPAGASRARPPARRRVVGRARSSASPVARP